VGVAAVVFPSPTLPTRGRGPVADASPSRRAGVASCLEGPAEAGVDGVAVAAAEGEEQEDCRPEDRFFRAGQAFRPHDPVEIDGDEQHDHRREGGRAGEEADRHQDAAEEFRGGEQRRPEDAGIEAEAFHHAGGAEGVEDLAVAMGDEEHAGGDAQDRFDDVMGGGVDRC